MPKRLSKRPTDVNQLAHLLGDLSTGQEKQKRAKKRGVPAEVSRIMAEMGRKGGKRSAKARMVKISPEQRREIALRAAQARWAKRADRKAD